MGCGEWRSEMGRAVEEKTGGFSQSPSPLPPLVLCIGLTNKRAPARIRAAKNAQVM